MGDTREWADTIISIDKAMNDIGMGLSFYGAAPFILHFDELQVN